MHVGFYCPSSSLCVSSVIIHSQREFITGRDRDREDVNFRIEKENRKNRNFCTTCPSNTRLRTCYINRFKMQPNISFVVIAIYVTNK